MREIMETNFWGPMNLTRAAIAVMRDVNPKGSDHGAGSGAIGGTIVNVSSIGGRVAFPNHAAYHASKFALEGFSEAVASELDPKWKIRILILEPGGTKSGFVTQSVGQRDLVPRYPAYSDPSLPVNLMLEQLLDPRLGEGFVEASAVAECLFDVLSRREDEGDELPLRLPTGKDAYGAIWAKETAKMDELQRWRAISEGVGGGKIPG